MKLAGFDWDLGNRDKCGKHGVSRDEIEEVFVTGGARVYPDPRHSGQETRFLAIGRTGSGRYVFVAFTLRSRPDGPYLRPISARYMHQKEVRRYEEDNSGFGE